MREVRPASLLEFVRESNRIEGILREPLGKEIEAHSQFLAAPPTISSLEVFVGQVQPDAVLRDRQGLNVVVGRYYPPEGGIHIRNELANILSRLDDPYASHQAYEGLHPFTDGNGRSGRVVWLWAMGGIANCPLGFLHHWYYQSLQNHCGLRVDGARS